MNSKIKRDTVNSFKNQNVHAPCGIVIKFDSKLRSIKAKKYFAAVLQLSKVRLYCLIPRCYW